MRNPKQGSENGRAAQEGGPATLLPGRNDPQRRHRRAEARASPARAGVFVGDRRNASRYGAEVTVGNFLVARLDFTTDLSA